MNSATLSRASIRKGPRALQRSTRCYATFKSMSPQARAAARAAQAYKAQRRQPDDEYDDIASRTPLKKPSTSGLGIPSAVPSPPKTPNPSHRSWRGPPEVATANTEATAGDATALAEQREAHLRNVRLRRHEVEELEKKADAEKKTYNERYKELGRRWTSGIIAMPILLVTSYYLFDRLVLGAEVKTIPKIGDDD